MVSVLPVMADKMTQPDFAFPVKVMESSEKSLSNALKKRDNQAVVQSLIDLCIAENSIDKNNVGRMIAKIDSVKNLTAEPTLLSMLNALEARMLTDVYKDNKYVYDRRMIPADSYSDDIFLWSGEQFRNKITNLVDASLENESALKKCPIGKYALNVSVADEDKVFYPLLYDFIAYQAIRTLNYISSDPGFVGRVYLVSGPMFVASLYSSPKINASTEYAKKILELYSSLLTLHADDVPAYINADLARLDYIVQHIYSYEYDKTEYAKVLTEMYNRYRESEYSGAILIALLQTELTYDTSNHPRLLKLIDSNIADYPHSPFADRLKRVREFITQKSVEIQTPRNVYPGERCTICVSLNNVQHADIKIYDISDHSKEFTTDSLRNLVPIAILSADALSDIPFSDKRELYFVFPGFGKFWVVPSFKDDKVETGTPAQVYVTSLAAVAREVAGDRSILVLDRVSGEPVDDAVVSFKKYLHHNFHEYVKIGVTDHNGLFSLPETFEGGSFIVAKGNDNVENDLWISRGSRSSEKSSIKCCFFTSLPIYHQGDSLDWAAEVYESNKYADTVAPDKEVSVILSDINRQPVDTLVVRTDSYGRVHGKFVIPKDRITGDYVLTMCCDNKRVGSSSVVVSDYVLPTFKITLSPVENNSPAQGDVTLRGNVATYSGASLGGTQVNLRLMNTAPFSYFPGHMPPYTKTFFTDSVTTDKDGEFTLVVPQSVIASSTLPGGLYIAEFSATNAAGKSQSAVTSFMTTASYRIVLSESAMNVEAPARLEIPVEVRDYKNEAVNKPLSYSVIREKSDGGADTIVANNPLPVDKLIPTENLPSGVYEIIVSSPDKSITSQARMNVVVYRRSDDCSPVPSDMIWSPQPAFIKVDKSRKLRWEYFADVPLLIHYAVAGVDGFADFNSFTAKRGFNIWEYEIPSGMENCKINLVAIKHNRSSNITLSVMAPPAESPIVIKAETFRNRVTTSQEETWKFYVENSENSPREVAVMMRMYNAALDALNSSPWYLPVHSNYIPFSTNFQSQDQSFGFLSMRAGLNRYNLYSPIVNPPVFSTYGLGLFGNTVWIRGTKMYKSQATLAAAAEGEVLMEDMGGAVNGVAETADAVFGYSRREVEADDTEAVVDHDDVKDDANDNFNYRDAEVPLAFFRPMLETGKDGKLTVSFTVPNANTTWQINTLAFTKNLSRAEFDATVIASKPVMVTPQVPGFVRKGDKVTIKALVINATDSVAEITTEIELYNPADNKLIAQSRVTNTVTAKGNVTATCNFDADVESDVIGYRVKSSTRLFADGEAGIIPVLPSVTPVIESTPFYISPGRKEISIPVEKANTDTRLTLEYTENPAWYVVSALPGLLSSDCSTSPQAAASIFSAAVAQGLMRDNPEIEKYLREWLDSDRSDTTFVSMLKRNADLKILLLSSTPWMLDAKNDTERMTRLALLFDKDEIQKIYDKNITLLTNLTKDDGGIAWMGQSMYSSDWATSNVLMLLGRLNRLGYLPADDRLAKIIDNGLAFLSKNASDVLIKNPDAVFPSYSMILSYFPEQCDKSGNRRAIDNTIENVISVWKNASVIEKAYDAILLNRFGKIEEARYILESIREFAYYSPEKGMWWPSIGQSSMMWYVNPVAATASVMEAFDEILPDSKEVEQIRQWLILQKEATDWKESVSTSVVVAAILKSSSNWLHPAGEVTFSVGGKSLTPVGVEKATGYFRTDISGLVSGKTDISIIRDDAVSASWGAVYSQGVAEMTEVAESSIDGLSISKRFLRYSGGGVEEVKNLTIGDKVRVELTIVTDRDMDYVAVDDCRAACFRPDIQLPRPVVSEGVYFYLENRSDCTRIFVDRMPRGRYIISYDMWVTNSGDFSSGIATLQSQYAPQLTAHSSGCRLSVVND
ncbi:MAG: hypothetical protein K2L14_07900 [Duncaniella sp.]|nr:hypothetical protein [Duncaniella sp.]